jgi:hypothetical protein
MAFTPNIRGALFMVLSMAGFTLNDSIVKLLTDEMSVGSGDVSARCRRHGLDLYSRASPPRAAPAASAPWTNGLS